MATPAQYRFSVKHKTNDTQAPYGGMRFLDVVAIDLETALGQSKLALASAGLTVVDKETFDTTVDAGGDADLLTYIVSVELKLLLTASVA